MIVSTTSLTVPPKAVRTVLTSLSRTSAQLQRRCGPIGPVSEEEATGRMRELAAIAARAASSRVANVSRGRAMTRCSDWTWPEGLALWASVRASTSTEEGSGGGAYSRPGRADPRSVVSENITDIRSVAATPSTMQWWTFESSAQRPSESPSTDHSSHSGLLRSRCCEKTREAIWRSCSSLPGCGIAVWRRW